MDDPGKHVYLIDSDLWKERFHFRKHVDTDIKVDIAEDDFYWFQDSSFENPDAVLLDMGEESINVLLKYASTVQLPSSYPCNLTLPHASISIQCHQGGPNFLHAQVYDKHPFPNFDVEFMVDGQMVDEFAGQANTDKAMTGAVFVNGEPLMNENEPVLLSNIAVISVEFHNGSIEVCEYSLQVDDGVPHWESWIDSDVYMRADKHSFAQGIRLLCEVRATAAVFRNSLLTSLSEIGCHIPTPEHSETGSVIESGDSEEELNEVSGALAKIYLGGDMYIDEV